MAWVGVAMAFTGAVLIYSGWRNLHPWQEFLAVLGNPTGSAKPQTPAAPGGEPAPPGGAALGQTPGGQFIVPSGPAAGQEANPV